MNGLEKKILQLFETYQVARNGILQFQSFQSKVLNFSRKEQDNLTEAIQFLTNKGYIEEVKQGFKLTSSGFDYLYSNITIEDTENEIMDVFYSKNMGVSHVLPKQALMGTKVSLHPKHKENLNEAIDNLLKKQFVEDANTGLRLLQAGYDHIY